MKSAVNIPITKIPEIVDEDEDDLDDSNVLIENIVVESYQEKSFSKENLLYFWNSFAKRYEKVDIRLFNILSVESIELKNNVEIHLGLFNSLQIENFERIKPQLLNYLMVNLENKQIQISVYVVENADIPKPLTLNEKFENMVKKNNLLKEFKDRLNLDFD